MGKLLDQLKGALREEPVTSGAPETVTGDVANRRNPAIDAARTDVVAEVAKRKRGRPRSDGSGGAGTGTTTPTADQVALAKIQEGLERLYRPEAWEPIVTLPANVAMAFTGHDHWNIPKDERLNLATTVSTAAQYAAIQNPRSLAFTLAAMAIITVYGPRIVKEFAMRKEEKKDEKDKKD